MHRRCSCSVTHITLPKTRTFYSTVHHIELSVFVWIIYYQTVKKLAASIEKLKAELSTGAGSKQSTAAANKTGSGVNGSMDAGSAIVRPTKLIRKQPVTTSEVTPTVTSSTADSTRTDDKSTDTASTLDQVFSLWQCWHHYVVVTCWF